LNFSPSGVSAPPPFGFWWHAAQDFPVCFAYCSVAAAGLETTKDVAAAIKVTAAMPQTRTNNFFAFSFIFWSLVVDVAGTQPHVIPDT
jgi:hypothetical protein